MKRMVAVLVFLASVLGGGEIHAQGVRLDVRALHDAAADMKVPEMVRNGTKTETLAPKMRLEASVATGLKVPLPATVEWYVFGKTTDDAKQAGRGTAAEWSVMQTSKEAISIKPPLGARTVFFAFAPGQVRNGARSEGWLVRLMSSDGRVIDAKASAANFLALAKDPPRLQALLAVKPPVDANAAPADGEIPLEILARIKADAEQHWPGNPEMQAIEIKNMTDAQRSAYKK